MHSVGEMRSNVDKLNANFSVCIYFRMEHNFENNKYSLKGNNKYISFSQTQQYFVYFIDY